MDTISFIGNGESPEKLLDLFKKQTPGCKGIWGNLKGEPHYNTTYHAVIDRIPNDLRSKVKEDKCVFLGAHPETMQAYQDMSSFKGIKMYDLKHTVGFLEWWIKYDYDQLKALQAPKKTELLCAIVSNANTQDYHKKRLEFLERFCNNTKEFNLYGRIVPTGSMKKFYRGPCGSLDARGFAVSGNDHMSGKEEVLLAHKYIAEFDATGENYFSERVLDDILLWCMPIYWGGRGMEKFLPKDCFLDLNIHKSGDDVNAYIHNNFYENNLKALAEARTLLLDKLQLWPRIHEAIYGTCK